MFNIPALTWTLTAVLLLGGTWNLVQAVRSRHLTDRVNNTLHTLMHALMAAMLWNLGPSTTLAQIAILTGAALWFTLQAVARPEFKLLCNGTPGRIKCAYHALTMAAAATMIALMTTHTPANTGAGAPPPATHHHAAAAHNTAQTTATAAAGPGNLPALLLTLAFAAAAATFLTLLLRRRRATTRHTPKHTTGTEHALEALSATTMALMFATMTA